MFVHFTVLYNVVNYVMYYVIRKITYLHTNVVLQAIFFNNNYTILGAHEKTVYFHAQFLFSYICVYMQSIKHEVTIKQGNKQQVISAEI